VDRHSEDDLFRCATLSFSSGRHHAAQKRRAGISLIPGHTINLPGQRTGACGNSALERAKESPIILRIIARGPHCLASNHIPGSAIANI
jgi:hypothetical protein